MAAYENIQTETKGRVGIIRLHRPKALNALCADLIRELGQALDAFEADPNIGCMVLTGSDKAFAAGADIKEMKEKSYQDVFLQDFITVGWERVSQVRETTLAEGVRFERRTFHATFAFEDRTEGMNAFADKRKPVWKHR